MTNRSVNRPSKEDNKPNVSAPIIASYNTCIRPLLDAVDQLRNLQIMKEGIELPTIVVVGDQSSGKSSVLESLAGISLPRGQGICTRVPLIMRLKESSSSTPELSLEYQGESGNVTRPTTEVSIAFDINSATEEIAGSGKGISNTPLTLTVKKNDVPDLTMVDLPGITRVPVHGQPQDIYEQISSIIMQYITPQESIILNVLSATVDFSTCESIRMSQRVDKRGERTLAVVTKADKAPEGLSEKVTTDAVNIGLGYVIVRNRIGDETYEEARQQERKLFASHPLLSMIDRSIVGIPVLAQKLVQIQRTSIQKCLPDIITKINTKLNQNLSELKSMPRILESLADAVTAFMGILGSAKESLRKILLRGEFEDFPEETSMHCTARMREMIDAYSTELHSKECMTPEKFLMEEISVLEESKGIGLPNFLPRTAFLTLLQRKVNMIANTPMELVEKIWNYLEEVVLRVLMMHSEAYPRLQSCIRRASGNFISTMRDQSSERVKEIVDMEKLADYTCNPEYMKTWGSLMEGQDKIMQTINQPYYSTSINIPGIGDVEFLHLKPCSSMIPQAFDMHMRLRAYWGIVVLRLVDNLALHILYAVQNLVNKAMEAHIVNELMAPRMGDSGGIEQMLGESPSTAHKRERLKISIDKLKEAKDLMTNQMAGIGLE